MSPRLAVGTIFAKNYLPFARVLADSFRRHHPDVDFVGVLADGVDGYFDPQDERFTVVTLEDLEIPGREGMTFRYGRVQLSVSAKAHLLRYLLDRGFEAALFLDADIQVTGSLSGLLERASRSSITIVPHLLAQLEDGDRAERELNILQSGVFNGGVIGVRESDTARAFLSWWRDRVDDHCRHSLQEGLHYDQRWLALVPTFFQDVCIVRDPAYNVAHWNLPERAQGDCRLFHFSGYDPDRPDLVTRYSGRLAISDIGSVAVRFSSYQEALERAGWNDSKSWPYTYERWDNGVPIPDLARRLYDTLGDLVNRFGDPFATKPGSYYAWLRESANGDRTLTNLWAGVYNLRPDVQAAFPDPHGEDREGFCDWALTSGVAEYGIPDALITA